MHTFLILTISRISGGKKNYELAYSVNTHLLVPGIYLIFFRKLGDIDHINLAHNIFTDISVIIAVPVTKSSNKEHMVHFHVSLPPDEVMGGKVPEF